MLTVGTEDAAGYNVAGVSPSRRCTSSSRDGKLMHLSSAALSQAYAASGGAEGGAGAEEDLGDHDEL